jgi:predicted transcriptional regulator
MTTTRLAMITRSVFGANIAARLEALVPAVPIKKSVQPEYIVCLEDGKKFQSLKRHLRKFDMT